MQVENENLFRNALGGGINLFLGAGFSLLAKDNNGVALPLGSQLATELVREFSLTDADALSLPQICTIIEHSKKERLRSYLESRLTVGSFDSSYRGLQRLNIKTIFTTNIDDLIFKIYADSVTHYLNDLDIRGASYNDRSAIDIVTLSGCVLDDNRPFSFNSLDLAAAFRSDPDRWHLLTSRLQTYPTLFWGYSMGDAATLEALNPTTVKGRRLGDRWIIVPASTDRGTLQYFTALDFQLVLADTAEFLEYVAGLDIPADVQVVVAKGRTTRDLFPTEAIPDVASVPVRPLAEFFLGAPPTWYDVFSNRIPRTRHLLRVRESINSGRHTLVIGVPASGKTTLLMQAAHEVTYRGHKLVCDVPSIEKAQLIVKRLEGEPALLFVDNFADSVDAVDFLSSSSNVLLVGCDRDYNFEIVSHKLNLRDFNIVDVTDVSDADFQVIVSHIPPDLRATGRTTAGLAPDTPVSLFELVETYLLKANLRTRFASVLRQLEKEDQRLADFLLVCAYVHSCRTPISMDMLLAFFRDRIAEYEEIYALRRRVGALVADYVGELDDGEQDYYMPRSTIAAEAIVEQASSEALNPVLRRFHAEVSPYRIHRYDVFKRKAYDAGLMRRVFGDWEEGRQFYEQAYVRDRSPYVLQQGALYLAHKRQFSKAFDWIDDAILQSDGRIPSIRNSHAIILFRANIAREETDGTVQRTLEQSMQILAECYHYDKRKAYHAITFADQALRYWDRYGNDQAYGYLVTAREWLENEVKTSPWNRNARRMLELVTRKVSRQGEA